jgi:hypothetical protein
MLDVASQLHRIAYLPILRLYKAYSCYQNGKISYKKITKKLADAISIPRYTGYYKEVIKVRFIFLESLKVFRKSKSFEKV